MEPLGIPMGEAVNVSAIQLPMNIRELPPANEFNSSDYCLAGTRWLSTRQYDSVLPSVYRGIGPARVNRLEPSQVNM
jgi:hypothetical protein